MIVVTDPFPASLGLRPDTRPATVVTVSNTHPNHCAWQEVAGKPTVFSAPGEYEYNGVSVRGVMTPLPADAPQERRNVAYTIEIDNINICHLGDATSALTTQQMDELKPVDVLLAPTGGRCTLSLDQVFQTLQDLAPKIVIPMHHETPGGDGAAGRPGRFREAHGRRRGATGVAAGGEPQQPAHRHAHRPHDPPVAPPLGVLPPLRLVASPSTPHPHVFPANAGIHVTPLPILTSFRRKPESTRPPSPSSRLSGERRNPRNPLPILTSFRRKPEST